MTRFVTFVILFSHVAFPCKGIPQDRVVPDLDTRLKKLAQIREIFEDEYKASKSHNEKMVFATKILKLADSTDDDVVGRFVLYSIAKDIAVALTTPQSLHQVE